MYKTRFGLKSVLFSKHTTAQVKKLKGLDVQHFPNRSDPQYVRWIPRDNFCATTGFIKVFCFSYAASG